MLLRSRLLGFNSGDTHADITYFYKCANQKRIGSWNKRFCCIIRYKFE